MTSHPRHTFGAAETAELLAELDVRLKNRGVAAAIFVVGGAAIAASDTGRDRVTADVDALYRSEAIGEEAVAIARSRGLAADWLNGRAQMWMPPLPTGVLDPPAEPGLRVTYADAGFLFATKLTAQRAKDADDILTLATELGLATATPEQLESHIRRYYTDAASLELIIDGNDVDTEIGLLTRDTSRFLNKAAAAARPDST